MKPSEFQYVRAESVEHAAALLEEGEDGAKVLAGGQSLIPLLRFRLTYVDSLIDIGHLDELAGVAVQDDGSLRIGATTRQRVLELSSEIRDRAPLLVEAAPLIAHAQIRNQGTIGGSLAHADPAAELPAVAIALDASIEAVSTRGRRSIAAQDLFVSYYTTELAEDEILSAISVGPSTMPEGCAILEMARRSGDFALAGMVVRLAGSNGRCELARVVAFGVDARPVRVAAAESALVGSELGDQDLADAAQEVPAALEPTADVHATAEYRRHAATVLCRRALVRARDRLRDLEVQCEST
jgi:aerobic carbon-monoxide dehydrogenase medium subunit